MFMGDTWESEHDEQDSSDCIRIWKWCVDNVVWLSSGYSQELDQRLRKINDLSK